MTKEELENRLTSFAGYCIRVCGALSPRLLGSTQISDQLFRSSTSVAANYSEACHAESRKDFIHKMKIVAKELAETRTWLKIVVASGRIPPEEMVGIIDEAEQLTRIIGSSISTAKEKME